MTVPSGKGHGKPFKLDKFQKDFIRDIYEPHTADNRRAVRRAILSMARKNGKTALIAALALAHLDGPEAIMNGEIYSAANDRDQAAIIFKFAKQIVELEPILRERIEVIASTKTMLAKKTGSIYRAVSKEAGTKHGFLPSVVIIDELAQAKRRDLYDVLDTSFGARDEPLFIVISTQSNDPEHILSKLIDDGLSGADPSIICHLHAADEDCDLSDETQWKKANPALDVFRDREDLASAIAKAIRMPADEPKVRNLFLNQRVAPTSTLISRVEWDACRGEAEFEDGEEVYLALDLSSVADLTALVMASATEPVRIKPFFWKPEEHLVAHSARDFGSGERRYQHWVDKGLMFSTPGRSINPLVVVNHLAELVNRYTVLGLAYDPWRMDDLLREFDNVGLIAHKETAGEADDNRGMMQQRRVYRDGLRVVPWPQSFKGMAPAIDALERAIFEGKLVQPNNPCLNWNLANAVATVDPAGNRKLDKQAARFRIDGAVALAMVMGLRSRDRAAGDVDIRSLIG